MSRTVADVIVETLERAGVKRCYGVPGDTLNYVTDAIRTRAGCELLSPNDSEIVVVIAPALDQLDVTGGGSFEGGRQLAPRRECRIPPTAALCQDCWKAASRTSRPAP